VLELTFKITVVLLTILFSVGFTFGQNDKEIYPKGTKIENQSFKVSFENFIDVEFASYAEYNHSPSRVNLYLLNNDEVLYELPEYFGNKNWSFDEIIAVSFKDLDFDELKDIIVMTNYITGMGPSGMKPFRVIDVYFQKKNGFEQVENISEELNNPKNYNNLETINDVVIFVRKFYE
jgi:hypothetical protein